MKINQEEQDSILDRCIKTGEKLSDALSRNGLSYEDLRYNDSFGQHKDESGITYHSLDEITPCDDNIPAVSFFSGAGGLDVGFKYAGFNNIISIEHTELFCNTLRMNDPDKKIIGPPEYAGDISDRHTIESILKANGINNPFNGVFHGGPPASRSALLPTSDSRKTTKTLNGLDLPTKRKALYCLTISGT